MEEVLQSLLKDAPWVAVAVYLLWRRDQREQQILEVCRAGAEGQTALAAAVESLENSLGAVERAIKRLENRQRQLGQPITTSAGESQ